MSSLHKYTKLLYIPFLVPVCINPVWRRRAINAFLIAMILTVFLSYLKQYFGLSMGEESLSSWVFHGHIETSFFIAFSAFIVAHRAVFEKKYRLIYWLLLAAFTFQEFFINDSRTGWVAYFSLLLVFFVQCAVVMVQRKFPNKPKAIWSLGMRWGFYGILIIALLGFASFKGSSAFRENVEEAMNAIHLTAKGELPKDDARYVSSSEFRMLFIQLSLDIAKQHPIFGVGTGSFPEAYRRSPGIPAWWSEDLNNPHNEYLLMLVQFGVIGLAVLLYFFLVQWRATFKFKQDAFIAQGLIFSFAVACFYNAFLYLTITGHFYILFSSVLLAPYFARQEELVKNNTLSNHCAT